MIIYFIKINFLNDIDSSQIFFIYKIFNTFYDNRVQNGIKDLFYIEALIAKLMYI